MKKITLSLIVLLMCLFLAQIHFPSPKQLIPWRSNYEMNEKHTY